MVADVCHLVLSAVLCSVYVVAIYMAHDKEWHTCQLQYFPFVL